MSELLWTSNEWSPETLERTLEAVCKVNEEELKLKHYPIQIEIITAEQMLDYYTSGALSTMYRHWSFGKRFARQQEQYQKGMTGLAYEIVQNANPNISYCMENNSSTLQALVMAHAGVGHNSYYYNNYFFREWTDAEGISDYAVFARNYIARAEEKYGLNVVSDFLDSCHALQFNGVNRYKRPPKLNKETEKERVRARNAYLDSRLSELDMVTVWQKEQKEDKEEDDVILKHPEENILYLCEKMGNLKPWQREIIRIVRKFGQFFYPNILSRVSNEGWASTIHFKILTRLHEKGLIDNGSYLEFLHSHSNVLYQNGFMHPRYDGFNPYKLGFSIYSDIERICTAPTDEDKEWFPFLIGRDPWEAMVDAMSNYRDESFIRQFLSPKVIRDMRLFQIEDDTSEDYYLVKAISDKAGYEAIRNRLADMHEWFYMAPNIEAVKIDKTTHVLHLEHSDSMGRSLSPNVVRPMLKHLNKLWGYGVSLVDKTVSTVPETCP